MCSSSEAAWRSPQLLHHSVLPLPGNLLFSFPTHLCETREEQSSAHAIQARLGFYVYEEGWWLIPTENMLQMDI